MAVFNFPFLSNSLQTNFKPSRTNYSIQIINELKSTQTLYASNAKDENDSRLFTLSCISQLNCLKQSGRFIYSTSDNLLYRHKKETNRQTTQIVHLKRNENLKQGERERENLNALQ